jgi:hypothetical protein
MYFARVPVPRARFAASSNYYTVSRKRYCATISDVTRCASAIIATLLLHGMTRGRLVNNNPCEIERKITAGGIVSTSKVSGSR